MGNLACTFCRSRKTACDRQQPSCTRCVVSGILESQLLHDESPLRIKAEKHTSEGVAESPTTDEEKDRRPYIEQPSQKTEWNRSSTSTGGYDSPQQSFPDISLQQKLYYLYFQQVDPVAPIIHKLKFLQALDGSGPAHEARAPMALRYAMWATAALVNPEYQSIAERLYKFGRKHAEELELNSSPGNLSLSQAQCWYLLASYEGSRAYFNRAWVSVGRCTRLVQMMGLYRLDSPDGRSHMLADRSWTDIEEGRRVFWAAYCCDRWSATMSGHPYMIRDEHICTNLPSSGKSFDLEIEEIGISLPGLDNWETFQHLSSFAGTITTTATLGKYLNHLRTWEHVPALNINHRFWESHREIDTSISLAFMNLPAHLRVSKVENDVNVVLTNFNLHLIVILLHQLATRTATKQMMDISVEQKSFQRCLTSAQEIKDTIYSVRDLKRFPVSIWTTFPIYVAAVVFITDLMGPNPSPNSPGDLGLLLIALNEISALQGSSDIFAKRLKKDIARARVDVFIPTGLRGMAGLQISEPRANTPDVPTGVPYCVL
ncbi:hypothetical protein DL98DRAFT_600156 [Cadophora sp. DSE1049]|nr:hypothetical protein DL98DRAFT_600156 [Cadophora sp. DSE1049]